MNVDHWDKESTKINYICFRTSKTIADYVYARFNNFFNNFYKIWENKIKNLTKIYENVNWKNKYCQLYLNL